MEGTLGPQQFGGDGKGKLDDHDFVQLSSSSGGALASNSHSEAVQALRKYLLRKMSSEGWWFLRKHFCLSVPI